MKATITFNLDSSEDAANHFRCVKSGDMALVLWFIKNNNQDIKTLDDLWEKINELYETHGIDLDKLMP